MNSQPPKEIGGPARPENTERGIAASAAPVDDSERVARFGYRPEHFENSSGNTDTPLALGPAAIPVSDLLSPERRGVSVFRIDKMTPKELDTTRAGFAGRSESVAIRCFAAPTKSVREIRDEASARVFCVVDDETPESKFHALIRLSGTRAISHKTARRHRLALLNLFRHLPQHDG